MDGEAPDDQAVLVCGRHFISYSRKDGAKYAAALANELSKPGSARPFKEIVSLESRRIIHKLPDVSGVQITFSADSQFAIISDAPITKANMTTWVTRQVTRINVDYLRITRNMTTPWPGTVAVYSGALASTF